jgi:TonB family protein
MTRALVATLVASAGAHAAAASLLARVELAAPVSTVPSTVAFEVSSPPPPPPPPELPAPAPAAPVESRPHPRPTTSSARRAPQPMVAAAPAADVIAAPPEPPPMPDALPVAGPPEPPPPARPPPPPLPPPPPEPRVVALTDLSARPVPPKLDDVLARNYPSWARAQGRRGDAVVRFRIDADGVVRQATVKRESEPGFGDACRATVLGSRWSPPRDHAGAAVATMASYTCRFEVD